MRPATRHINISKITSFDSVLAELVNLESWLPNYEFEQFLIFNKAYFVVTKSIKKAAENGYFHSPEFIENFTVNFAHFYFMAVNGTVRGSKDLPAAWKKLNQAEKYKSTPNFILLLMGANAHINHDLPLALLGLMDKEKTDDLLRDVFKIDKLLMKSGREIIGLFDEPNKLLGFLKRHFIFLYYRPAMYTILYWRTNAWRNYKSIKRTGLKNSTYQKSSIRIANRLLKLASVLTNGN